MTAASVRGSLLALTLAVLAGCPPPVVPAGDGSGPLASTPADSVTRIDVRALPGRPRLTLIARQGDPLPSLAIGVAAQAGPALNTALAALMTRRLETAGQRVHASSDGIGFRLRFELPDADGVAGALRAWTAAAGATVQASEAGVGAARDKLAALGRHPLDGVALAPLARCSAELTIVASAPLPDMKSAEGIAELERWRNEALVHQRTSIAFVGTRDDGDAVIATLRESDGWRSGEAPESRWEDEPQHAAYLSPSLPIGGARLDVALRTPSAQLAVVATKRMSRPGSALESKLAALQQPWSLVSARATAHPHGGCVRLALRPAVVDEKALPQAAARALASIERELGLQTALGASPFEVTREIVGSGDAATAALRAAWWTLSSSQPAAEQAVTFSALALSAHAPDEPDKDASSQRAAALDQRYRAAIAAITRPSDEPIADRRLKVERGQGAVWMLLASPCVLSHEGQWDSGRAALAAAAASARDASASSADVSLLPFVSPDGIGVVAHATLSRADEPAALLARRVARTLGRTVAALPRDDGALARGRRSVLAMLADENARGYAALARLAAPQRPSWLAPWGRAEDQAGFTLDDLRQRWRSLLSGPLRAAVLANADADQASQAFDELDRWLLSEARSRPCPAGPAADAAGAAIAGQHVLPKASGAHHKKLLVGVPLPAANLSEGAADFAELTAAALDGEGGLLETSVPAASSSARVLGGGGVQALVVEARCSTATQQRCHDKVMALFDRLAKTGLTDAQRARAEKRARERFFERRRQPLERLSAVWRGDERGAPAAADADAWHRFVATHLAADRRIVLSDPAPSP